MALLLLAGGVGLFYLARPSAPVTSPSEYTQITNFTDSAVAPSLSPDGRMVTFKRGEDSFLSRGQIYVKLLPNGESVRLTNDRRTQVRTSVYTGRIADRVYQLACFRYLGYLDRSGARRPADAAPAQRLRTHLDRRSSGAVFRDQDRPPHGNRDRDGGPGGLARDLYSAERARDGALLLRVTGPSVGACRRDDRAPTRLLNRAGWYRSMEALRAGRSDLRAHARQPPGLRTDKWMYFGAIVEGSSHLWRQKFPDGAPEQITFGPLEEEGIAVAPDGRSLVTSVGTRRSAIWIHDAAGERAISSEGYAAAPRLSRDGTRVFFLSVQGLGLSRAAGWHRQPNCARWTSLPGRPTVCCRACPSPITIFRATRRKWPSRQRTAAENRRFGWRPSTGAHHLAQIARAGDQVSFGC